MRKAPLILFLVPGVLFADEVFLKDAGSISGRIVERTKTAVQVDVGDGIIGVPIDRVARIVSGRSALDEYEERARKLAPDDIAGWKTLGTWASGQGLTQQAHRAFQKVLLVDPTDAEANKAFGLVSLNGKWVTLENSYKAQGYVRYDGEWMTPAQAQLADTNGTNSGARRDAEPAHPYNIPVYWGGWGYGVTTWPAAGVPGSPRNIPPSQNPVRTPR